MTFLKRQRNSSHFHLVSGVDNSEPIRHERSPLAMIVLVSMVLLVATGAMNLLSAGLIAACLMVMLGCCSLGQARDSVDWSLLVVIAAALGIGKAVEMSGLAGIGGRELGCRCWRKSLAGAAGDLFCHHDLHRSHHKQCGGGARVSHRSIGLFEVGR